MKAFSITSTDLTIYTIRDNLSLSVTICHSLSLSVTICHYFLPDRINYKEFQDFKKNVWQTDTHSLTHSDSVTDRTRPREACASKKYFWFKTVKTLDNSIQIILQNVLNLSWLCINLLTYAQFFVLDFLIFQFLDLHIFTFIDFNSFCPIFCFVLDIAYFPYASILE